MEREKLIQLYLSGYTEILSALNRIDYDAWEFIPSSGNWSIREIAVHLNDSEINGYSMCRKIIAEPAEITAYDQDKWTSAESTWENYFIHPEQGKVTLDDRQINYENHVHIHLDHMRRNFELWNKSH